MTMALVLAVRKLIRYTTTSCREKRHLPIKSSVPWNTMGMSRRKIVIEAYLSNIKLTELVESKHQTYCNCPVTVWHKVRACSKPHEGTWPKRTASCIKLTLVKWDNVVA
jgi:hypothetical protein